jgi:hypothetical protein
LALAQRQVLVDCLIAIVREKKLNAGTTAKAVPAGVGSPFGPSLTSISSRASLRHVVKAKICGNERHGIALGKAAVRKHCQLGDLP